MSSTLVAPAMMIRSILEQDARAIIGSRIRSPSGRGWAMCVVVVDMLLRAGAGAG
jgi:hypothetical protein